MVDMINRELSVREREIYDMIPGNKDDITFGNIVDIVRRDTDISRYSVRKQLKRLHNQ